MNKVWLWVAAIAVIVGPCLYIQSGSLKMMSGTSQMALVVQMRQQVMLFEAEMQESFSFRQGPMDASVLQGYANAYNRINANAKDPASQEMARKEGLRVSRVEPIPWMVAPAKAPRSLTLEVLGDDLVIRGWGQALDQPIFERRIVGVAAVRQP